MTSSKLKMGTIRLIFRTKNLIIPILLTTNLSDKPRTYLGSDLYGFNVPSLRFLAFPGNFSPEFMKHLVQTFAAHVNSALTTLLAKSGSLHSHEVAFIVILLCKSRVVFSLLSLTIFACYSSC